MTCADLNGGDEVAKACDIPQASADGLKALCACQLAASPWRPPARKPAQAVPIQSQIHNMSAIQTLP